MFGIPKKGALSDLHIELDHRCTLKSFIAALQEENAKYSYDNHEDQGLIYFYITEGTQPTKRKKKQEQEQFISKDDILNKYLPELCSRQVNNASSRLFLITLFINPQDFQRFSSLDELEEKIVTYLQDSIKFLLILENVKEWIRAQTLDKSCVINIEDFNAWLLRMQLDHKIDHCCTDSSKSTIDVLAGCMSSTIQAKYSRNNIAYQGGKSFNEDQARLAGVSNTYQLEFVSMLLTIQGLTDLKAIAIVQKYPSFKQLMQAYRGAALEDRINLLSNIKYNQYVDDPNNPNQKRIGPIISERVYILVTTNNPNEALYQ